MNTLNFEDSKYLFLVSEVRSGSTYFAETFAYSAKATYGAEFWDLSKEHFNKSREPDFNPLEICNSLYKNTYGFRSSKLMVNEISVILKHSKNNPELSDKIYGDNVYYIILRRRNRIRQAISLAYASETDAWHVYGIENVTNEKKISISNHSIMRALKIVSISDIYLERFQIFLENKNVNTLSLFYEDFINEKKETLNAVFKFTEFDLSVQTNYVESPLKVSYANNKKMDEKVFSQFFLKEYGIDNYDNDYII